MGLSPTIEERIKRLEKRAGANSTKTDRKLDTETRDPWEHRSRGMRCLTCMWFVMKVPDHNDDAPEFGRCRRHAPTMSGYPAVFGTDWCGDHKLDEGKI